MKNTDTSLGLHLLQTIQTTRVDLLTDAIQWIGFVKEQLKQHHLTIVGEAFHVFDTHGFTATFCLMESHLSVHTWPEHGYLTFDVYLCNHSRRNEETVLDLGAKNLSYFEGVILKENTVER